MWCLPAFPLSLPFSFPFLPSPLSLFFCTTPPFFFRRTHLPITFPFPVRSIYIMPLVSSIHLTGRVHPSPSFLSIPSLVVHPPLFLFFFIFLLYPPAPFSSLPFFPLSLAFSCPTPTLLSFPSPSISFLSYLLHLSISSPPSPFFFRPFLLPFLSSPFSFCPFLSSPFPPLPTSLFLTLFSLHISFPSPCPIPCGRRSGVQCFCVCVRW